MTVLRTVVNTRNVLPEANAIVLRTTGAGVNDSAAHTSKASGVVLHVAAIVAGLSHAQRRLAKKSLILKRDGSIVNLVVPRESLQTLRSLQSGEMENIDAIHVLQAYQNLCTALKNCGVTVNVHAHDGGMGTALDKREELIRKEAAKRKKWVIPTDLQEWVEANSATIVYTDASGVSDTGFAAWAWWTDEDHYDSGVTTRTTSGAAEQMAIGKALAAIEGPVLVVADSVGITRKDSTKVWTKHRQQVHQSTLAAYDERVRIHKVTAHADCPGNVAVDTLARRTAKEAWALILADPIKQAAVLADWEAELQEQQEVNEVNAENWRRIHCKEKVPA